MRSVTRLGRFLAATVAVAAVGLVAPAGAVAGESSFTPQITVSPSTVETGGTFTVSGQGWQCSDDIIVLIENASGSETVGTVLAADIVDGSWSLQSPALPISVIPLGTYTVRAYFADNCSGAATDELVIVAAATTTTLPPTTQQIIAPAPSLPETGASDSRTAAMAAGILALGAALIWMARRPRSAWHRAA